MPTRLAYLHHWKPPCVGRLSGWRKNRMMQKQDGAKRRWTRGGDKKGADRRGVCRASVRPCCSKCGCNRQLLPDDAEAESAEPDDAADDAEPDESGDSDDR